MVLRTTVGNGGLQFSDDGEMFSADQNITSLCPKDMVHLNLHGFVFIHPSSAELMFQPLQSCAGTLGNEEITCVPLVGHDGPVQAGCHVAFTDIFEIRLLILNMSSGFKLRSFSCPSDIILRVRGALGP